MTIRFSRQELALISITVVWGGTFLAVQHAMTVSGPMAFVGFRFAVAAIVLALISLPVLRGLTMRECVAGAAIGSMIFVGYALQTVGLQTISSSKSAFITAMYVPLVPILQWVVFRKAPRIMSWLGVAFAFCGLVLLAGPEAGAVGFELGEILTLIGALGIAAEIILISLFAGTVDSRRITVVQLAVTAIISFAMMPMTGEAMPEFSWTLLLLAGGLGLASAIIQLTMNWAQKSVSPTRATVIYAGEPVWAGIIGRLAGERLPAVALFGGVLIVVGVIVSEMQPKRRFKPKNDGLKDPKR